MPNVKDQWGGIQHVCLCLYLMVWLQSDAKILSGAAAKGKGKAIAMALLAAKGKGKPKGSGKGKSSEAKAETAETQSTPKERSAKTSRNAKAAEDPHSDPRAQKLMSKLRKMLGKDDLTQKVAPEEKTQKKTKKRQAGEDQGDQAGEDQGDEKVQDTECRGKRKSKKRARENQGDEKNQDEECTASEKKKRKKKENAEQGEGHVDKSPEVEKKVPRRKYLFEDVEDVVEEDEPAHHDEKEAPGQEEPEDPNLKKKARSLVMTLISNMQMCC